MSESDKPIQPVHEGYPEPIYPPPTLSPAARFDEPERNQFLEYVDVILARRFTIIAVLVTVVTIAMIRTFKEVPVYRATVQLELGKENPKILSFQDSFQVAEDDGLQTQYKVLASRSLARSVIEDLRLDQSQPQAESKPDVISSLFRGAKNLVSTAVSYVLASPKPSQSPLPVADEGDALRPYIDEYLGGLTVTPVLRTRLVNVSYEVSDPRMAALVVNSHAEHFIDQNLRSKFEATQVASSFLTKQLTSMKANLEKAEDNLQEYSSAHQILFLEDGKNSDTTKLAQLENEYTKAQTERILKASSAKLLREQGLPDPAADSRLAELRREDAKLAVTYKEDYDGRKIIRNQIAEIERTIEKERVAAIRRAEADYAAATDREELFHQAFQKQRERVDRMNQGIVQYNILKRQADSNRALYDTLLQRLKEAEISSSLMASSVRIVDRAEIPTYAVRPVKTQSLLNGLAIGLALGVCLAFFQEYMDRSLKSPDDVTKYMKLPTLAIIPRMDSVMGKGAGAYKGVSSFLAGMKRGKAETNGMAPETGVELITQESPSSLLSEAFRSLRASFILSSPDHPPRAIVVSSAVPGEGKTSTAVNLAVSLTQIGARVALIDGDMRKPRIDRIFQLRHKPGLSNFLAGTEQFKNVIYETAIPNLFVIPCGVIPPNPSELILSNRFKQMLEVLRKYFDYVVVDSPPLNNVSDGRILASTVDAVIMVVRAMSTSRHVVLRSLDYLEDTRSRLIGVVLNDYSLKSKGGYYYSYGSGRYYQQYHYQSNENEAPEGSAKV